MTTDQSIQQTLNDDYNKFYSQVYSQKPGVPENLIELFIKGINALAPQSHKVNFHFVRKIATSTPESLTYRDLHEVIKVVVSTPFEKLYDVLKDHDFLPAVDKHIRIEKFVIDYNQATENFRNICEMKRKNLQDLAGRSNGMKIIAKA